MGYTKKETLKAYFSKPINRLKTIYSSMVSRCCKKEHRHYKYYGAKGITICDEWLKDPQAFYDWAIESGFEYMPDKNGRNKLTIDRIDGTKGYSPNNCRWTTMVEQNNNKIDNIYFDYNGESRTLRDWCRILNLPYSKIYYRVYFKKQTFEQSMLGKDFKFVDKKPATNYRYIYKQKDIYVVQIKKKYYGGRKTLEEAIELRNSILEEMGLLDKLIEFELKEGK